MRSVVAVVLLLSGIIGGAIFAYSLLTTEASHLTPTPSLHVDIGASSSPASTGNTYVEDPNSDFDAADQLMSVPQPLTACVSRTVTDFTDPTQFIVVTDFIFENADEMTGADVRLNYNPARINLLSTSITPFIGGSTGQSVGLLNLPAPPYFPFSFSTHATASPATAIDNVNGAAFLAGTYLGTRTFAQSTESGPTVDGAANILPNRNAGHATDGGVFFRVTWRLLDVPPAGVGPEDTADILLDLAVAGPSFTGGGVIAAGSGFVSLVDETPTQERIVLSDITDLFDGVIRVNPPDATCNAPGQATPTATPVATATATPPPSITPTATPTPGGPTPTPTPVSTPCDGDGAPSANSDICTSFDIPAPEPFFSDLISFTPPEFTVPAGGDMPIGAVVAELTSNATLGLINGPCANPINVAFTFVNASVDITDTIVPLPLDRSDNLQNLAADANANGIPDGADRYPSYLKDPEVFGNTQPRARYFGSFFIQSAQTTVILNLVFFQPGISPTPDLTLDPSLGYPNVIILQDPSVIPPGLITDICSPFASNTTVFGVSKDNVNTPGDESGHVVRLNPANDGIYNLITWSRRLPDADGDGLENSLDTCPFDTNLEDPRQPAPSGDPDLDSIDSACDPDPDNTCVAPQSFDCDSDGFLNRGDNCPLIANGLDQDSQADADNDGIGDACDPNPNTIDGARPEACTFVPITIGAGGPPPSGTVPLGTTTCPPASAPAEPTPTATATPTPTPTATATVTSTPTATPLPPDIHDARVRRISSPFRILGMGDPDLGTVDVTFRNEGSHGETIGLYLDVIPPGGPSNLGGCIPAGRILATTAFLDANRQLRLFADTGTLGDGKVEFSCTNQAVVIGLPYTIIAAVDVHADDAVACGPGLLLSLACFAALADDDTDPLDNRILRSAPRVQAP